MWRGPYSVSNNPRVLSVIIAELNPIDIQLDLLDFTFELPGPYYALFVRAPLNFTKALFWTTLGKNVINYTQ